MSDTIKLFFKTYFTFVSFFVLLIPTSFTMASQFAHLLKKKLKSMHSFGKQNHLLSRTFRINKLSILSYFAVLLSSGKDYTYHHHHLYISSPNLHSLEYLLYIVEMLMPKLARLTPNEKLAWWHTLDPDSLENQPDLSPSSIKWVIIITVLDILPHLKRILKNKKHFRKTH